MVKTNRSHHQALNRILNLAEGWIPLTGPLGDLPLSLHKSGRVEGAAFMTSGSEALRALWFKRAVMVESLKCYY